MNILKKSYCRAYQSAFHMAMPMMPYREPKIMNSVSKIAPMLKCKEMKNVLTFEKTAEIAVRAAITGHLVFSTLHTNDAPGAITRLEDMGIADYLVSDALVGVIAQRLVKRLCPECKKRGKTNAKEMEILGINEPISIFRPHGCHFCNGTGYKGRIAVHEIMYMNENMRSAVAREKNLDVLRELAKKNGMVTLWNSCHSLVVKGITSIQELMTLNIE